MALSAEQLEQVKTWVLAGETLAGVQKRIAAEFKVSMTYMDVRFLVDDLNVALVNKAPAKAVGEVKPGAAVDGGGEAEEADAFEEDEEAGVMEDFPGAEDAVVEGKVTVELDKMMRPGAVVSGTVTFSDGVSAAWLINQMGRLGFASIPQGYQPKPEDIQEFQVELQKLLQKAGF